MIIKLIINLSGFSGFFTRANHLTGGHSLRAGFSDFRGRARSIYLDESQPAMNCGTHIITGGTGKYAGITGSEPFACNAMPALAGAGGYTAMDIPHNTAWEIKGQ